MLLKLKKTGNFYIDNGLIALYRALENHLDEDDEPVKMTSEELLIEMDNENKKNLLNEVLEFTIREELTGETRNYGWFYDIDSNKIKKYKKRDWKLFAKYFFGQIAPSPKGSIDWKGADSILQKEVSDFIQNNELSHYSKNKIPTSKMEYRMNVGIKDGKSNQNCNLCGQTLPLSQAKKYNMPFWITLDKMKTFYSNHGRPYKICSYCSIASLFAPTNLFYNISILGANKEETIFFMIHDDDLREMFSFYQRIRKVSSEQKKTSIYCNFEKSIITYYLKETLLAFLYELYKGLKNIEADVEDLIVRNFPTKKIIGFIGKKEGNNVSFFNLFEFTQLSELMIHIFMKLDKNEVNLVPFLIAFHEDIKSGSNTFYREKLSDRILKLDYLNDIIEEFIFKTFRRIPYLIPFLQIYNQEVFIMSKRFNEEDYQHTVKSCFGLGWEIGNRCYGPKDKPIKKKSFLFDIRNSKTLDEFLEKLNQIQFDLSMQLNKKIIEALALDLNNWEKYKSIICISAVNAYLSSSDPKNSKGGTQNEQ